MPLQINTSKWSPSDALKQRIMGAMEREAQYSTALLKQKEAIRKETITTEAMQEYGDIAGSPTATREQVYSATQRAFGRLVGVDQKAASAFATNSALYPKYNPTDLNTSELEAMLKSGAAANMSQVDVLRNYDVIQKERSQAKMLAGGKLRVIKGPNQEDIIIQDRNMYNPKTNAFDLPAPPDIKISAVPSSTGTATKDLKSRQDNAIKAAARMRTVIEKQGGFGPLDNAAKAYTEAMKKPEVQKVAATIPEDPEATKKLTDTEVVDKFASAIGRQAKDTAEARAFVEMLRVGRDYVNATTDYHAQQAILAKEGYYVDPDNLEIHELKDGKRPLRMSEKSIMNSGMDWSKASEEDLLMYSNPDDKANYIPSAASFVIAKYKK